LGYRVAMVTVMHSVHIYIFIFLYTPNEQTHRVAGVRGVVSIQRWMRSGHPVDGGMLVRTYGE